MKSKTIKPILAAIVSALALTSHAAFVRAEPLQQWSIATAYPADTVAGRAISQFATLANKKANGWLRITPEFSHSARKNIVLDTSSGQLDFGDAFSGALSHLDPVFEFPTLPFQVKSIKQARQLANAFRPAYARALENHGLHLMFITPWPATGLWSRSALSGDIQALRIRTYDSNSAEILSQLGTYAHTYPIQQVGHLIQSGAIDAILSSGDGAVGKSFAQALPNFAAIDYARPLSFVFLSKSKYDALSDMQRKQLDAAAKETELEQWQLLPERIAENYRNLAKDGVHVMMTVDPVLANQFGHAGEASLALWRSHASVQEVQLFDDFLLGNPRGRRNKKQNTIF